MTKANPMELCPFDHTHRIQRTKLALHITKCAKNYPHVNLIYCPYDRRHWVPPKDYHSHMKSCPAKEFFYQTTESPIVSNSTIETPGIIPVQPFASPRDESVKVWDTGEASRSPLQSIKATMETHKFAAPRVGASKSQKWKYRSIQRRLASESSSDQGEASGQDQTEQHKQENCGKTEDDGASSQSASGEQDTSDDSKENICRPAVKAESKDLNISGLKIITEKNATATKRQNSDAVSNSEPKPFYATLSYAAALGSKNKQHRRI